VATLGWCGYAHQRTGLARSRGAALRPAGSVGPPFGVAIHGLARLGMLRQASVIQGEAVRSTAGSCWSRLGLAALWYGRRGPVRQGGSLRGAFSRGSTRHRTFGQRRQRGDPARQSNLRHHAARPRRHGGIGRRRAAQGMVRFGRFGYAARGLAHSGSVGHGRHGGSRRSVVQQRLVWPAWQRPDRLGSARRGSTSRSVADQRTAGSVRSRWAERGDVSAGYGPAAQARFGRLRRRSVRRGIARQVRRGIARLRTAQVGLGTAGAALMGAATQGLVRAWLGRFG
jgi:hypothetical protein